MKTTMIPSFQGGKLRHGERCPSPNWKFGECEPGQWQPAVETGPWVLSASVQRMAGRHGRPAAFSAGCPGPSPITRPRRWTSRTAGVGGEKERAAAGRPGRLSPSPGDGKGHLIGKELPVPWSWQGVRCLPAWFMSKYIVLLLIASLISSWRFS